MELKETLYEKIKVEHFQIQKKRKSLEVCEEQPLTPDNNADRPL